MSASRARPTTEPTTAPAMVPPETFLRWIDCCSEFGFMYGTGVEVTVCVTAPPETVTTLVEVTGLGVVMRTLEEEAESEVAMIAARVEEDVEEVDEDVEGVDEVDEGVVDEDEVDMVEGACP